MIKGKISPVTKWYLSTYKDVFDDKDADFKLRWLEANEHKSGYWQQWLRLNVIKEIGRDMYNPDTVEIADWMIRERKVKVLEKRICFNPRAFCWDSGKRLFLRPATVVHTLITGQGDPLKETFYFEPKRYTHWLLKN